MIMSRKELIAYLKAEESVFATKKRGLLSKLGILSDSQKIRKFQRLYRIVEYLTNTHKKNIIVQLYRKILELKLNKMAERFGFTIPINVIDKGLVIPHRGTIIINPHAVIGENCTIHAGVNIGAATGTKYDAPKIGKNVFIGPGVKIFGNITIADNIDIGANSVVNKSFHESGITIAGVPAKKVSNKSYTVDEARL